MSQTGAVGGTRYHSPSVFDDLANSFAIALKGTRRSIETADQVHSSRTSQSNTSTHVVTSGETLSSIARKYQLSLPRLLAANPQYLRDPNRIRLGAKVVVPRGRGRDHHQAVVPHVRASGVDLDKSAMRPRLPARVQVPAPRNDKAQLDAPAETSGPTPPTPFTPLASQAELLRQAQLAEHDYQQAVKAKKGDALTQAEKQRDAAWNAFRQSIAEQLHKAGDPQPFPDEASQPVLAQLKTQYRGDPKALEQITEARTEVDAAWRTSRITGGQLHELVTDAQNARQKLKAWTRDNPIRLLGQPPGAFATLAGDVHEKWERVQRAIERELRYASGDEVYPEDATRPRLEALRAHLPANDEDASRVLAQAQAHVVVEFRLEGRTRDTFGIVVDKAQALSAAMRTGNQTDIGRAQDALTAEIRRQLEWTQDPANVAPQLSALAGVSRARVLDVHGPQDAAFKTSLDRAAREVWVDPRVKRVKDAYEQSGVTAAARELAAMTDGAPPPLAAQIIEGSLRNGTVGKIADSLKEMMWHDAGQFRATVANISQASEQAARDAGGRDVVAKIADALVPSVPDLKINGMPANYGPSMVYASAIVASVESGGGASLPLAIAARLDRDRRTEEADWMRKLVAAGVSQLQRRVDDAVDNFFKTIAVVHQIRAGWGGLADSKQQVDDATMAYLGSHPEFLPAFDRALQHMDEIAGQALVTNSVIGDVLNRPSLPPSNGVAMLRRAWEMMGEDKKWAFAAALSETAESELLYRIQQQSDRSLPIRRADQLGLESQDPTNPNKPIGRGKSFIGELAKAVAGTMSTGSLADPVFSDDPRQLRRLGFFRGLLDPKIWPRTLDARGFAAPPNIKMDPKKTVPAVGLANAIGIWYYWAQANMAAERLGHDPASLFNAAKLAYSAAGMYKEGAETLAVLVQNTSRLPWPDRLVEFTAWSPLVSSNRSNRLFRPDVINQPGWARFSALFKVGSIGFDLVSAGNSAAVGHWLDSAFYAWSAAGGYFSLGASLFDSKTLIGKWGTAWGGLVSLAAAFGLYVNQTYESAAEFEKPTEDFLVHLGYDRAVAHVLADYDKEGNSAGPPITALLERLKVTPQDFKKYLNGLPAAQHENLSIFVKAARRMKPTDSGEFRAAEPRDDKVRPHRYWVPGMILGDQPNSLNGLYFLGRKLLPGFPQQPAAPSS